MSYQLKYFLEYKSLKVGSTNTYRLELWQNTETVLVAEEIKGGQSPFILEMPQISHKFQVVRGRGCVINLLSDTDMKFFAGLKHIDPKEFKIFHKINGVVNWSGYLNSDMYSEPYDQSTNYIISTTGNDGFSLMDRYRFLQSDESRYVGLKTKSELLQICLGKVGLDFTDIRIKLATTIADYVIPDYYTLLDVSVINCDNFYDEDGLAMTAREVVDSILSPYGAFIFQDNNSIYITDIHTLAGGGTITFKSFNPTTFAYIEDISINVEKDIYDIGYFGAGQNIDRSGGTNLQKVIYSPLPQKNIINELISSPNEFDTVPDTFGTATSGGYSFKFRTLSGNPYWELLSTSYFEESYGLEIATNKETDRKTYVVLPRISGSSIPLLRSNLDNVHLSIRGGSFYADSSFENKTPGLQDIYNYGSGVAILLTGDLFLRTRNNPYDINERPFNTWVFSINYALKIGNYFYNATTGIWSLSPYYDNELVTSSSNDALSDRWANLGLSEDGVTIPIFMNDTDIIDGKMTLEIRSKTYIIGSRGQKLYDDANIKEIWIGNLSMRFININGSEISDSDVVYNGYLNKLFAQEGESITLTTGTEGRFTDLAKIMRYEDGKFSSIKLWTRAGQSYKIEELLLNSLSSNYRDNYLTLLSVKLKNEFSLLTVFTDTTFLEDNPKMMVKSSMIDYANYVHEVALVEISEDELTIVKE